MKNNWTFENGKYHCNGWVVWSNGFEWKVKNPNGYVYAVCYANLKSAERFAERKMK